jgi:glutathione S-transferase
MVEFVELEEAKARGGLRMSCVAGVPSPWGEAAKGILFAKKIPWVGIRLAPGSTDLVEWTGQASAPVALYEDEPPRSGWAEILVLAERLAPELPLVPEDCAERATLFGLSHEICGEMGLGWCRRLTGVADGLEGRGGFSKGIAGYLGSKYGYRDGSGPEARQRVIDIVAMLAARLHENGSGYYLGDRLTVLDIYSAAFMVMFKPLPEAQCPMPAPLRAAFETTDEPTRKALDPILFEHRDRIYAEHLELPLTL